MAITTSEAARALTEAGRRSPALRCRGLRKQFGDKAVVADVSFTVPAGDILALVGPSGCGKTTLLRLIAGFERLDGGAVEIDGQTMADDTRHVPPEGRRVGMVFQDYAVFPHLSVGRNVGFALGKGCLLYTSRPSSMRRCGASRWLRSSCGSSGTAGCAGGRPSPWWSSAIRSAASSSS